MTALHTEKALEDEICHDLAAADWLHDSALPIAVSNVGGPGRTAFRAGAAAVQ